ncbi:hypothetical protein CPAV1605_797 [seawater metagenome]|uniref:GT-D fold-like domain-containing protein n=1 Tax=seawater metagenome TaxID=1561972 RepID=A0A5E8CLW8_9ZZZZ
MIYLSVTTIPSRINNFYSFYENIMDGIKKPHKIILNVYITSLRGTKLDIPTDLNNLDNLIIIKHSEDYGPILKFLAVFEDIIKDEDIFIYCDDDIIYSDNWLETLINNIQQNPKKISSIALNSGVNTFCRFRYFTFNGFNSFLRGFAGVGFYKRIIKELNKMEIIHFLDSFEKKMSDDLIISYFINKNQIQCCKVKGDYKDFCYETEACNNKDSISQGVNGLLLPNKQKYHLICLDDPKILKFFDIESYIFCLNKGDKDIYNEFNKFKSKLIKSEHFSLIRFGDGELHYIKRSSHSHTEHSCSENEIPLELSELLVKSLELNDKNYFIGIPCGCLEKKDNFRKNLNESYNLNLSNCTFANLFTNSMSFKFKKEILPIIKKFPIVLISNNKTDVLKMQKNNFNIIKWFPVKYNAWKDYKTIIEDVCDHQRKNKIVDHIFIFCAGPVTNVLAYKLFLQEKKNIYLDLGSSIDVELGLGSNTRNYNSWFGWKKITTCYWNTPTFAYQISCNSSSKSQFFRFCLRFLALIYTITNIISNKINSFLGS